MLTTKFANINTPRTFVHLKSTIFTESVWTTQAQVFDALSGCMIFFPCRLLHKVVFLDIFCLFVVFPQKLTLSSEFSPLDLIFLPS